MSRSNKKSAPTRGAHKKRISGIVQVTRKGTGYMPWIGEPEKEDLEIRAEDLHGALNGDQVEVEITGLYPRPQGKVIQVTARAKTTFVASMRGGRAVPADPRFSVPIEVTGHAAEGSKVLVELLSYDGRTAKGAILETIGKAGEHRTEMNAIVMERGFRTEFPKEVEREAQEIERTHAAMIGTEAAHRADYRNVPTFTIDPADAKDFDDALSVRELENGEWEIGVHIADVTFFCRPGSALETEAQKRGTSVYLVDATIPMLPHELSGNVCSLRQDEDRLVFSAVFRMNRNAEVLERRFERSVIRSSKRFTYEEAQEVLDTGNGPLLRELTVVRDLGRTLKKRRDEQGAIDFGSDEVKFTLDENGTPIAVTRKTRIDTNSLIEEFMLLANREVAQYVSALAAKVPEHGLVFLYRIHDEPKADRIEDLAAFVRAVGYEFGTRLKEGGKSKKFNARDIAKLLEQIEGTPEEHLIKTATLRSMAKAIYSTKNIGHFGLAFEHYTHFTSPIRRYPDMLVHRILASHLTGGPLTRHEFGDLERLCIAASEQEAKAVDAERESIRYKQVEYMLPKVGQTFEGVVSGVTNWGLYVEEKESAAEGLIRVRSLSDDFYNYSQKDYALVGERTKRKFSLGDPVKVRLVNADLAARTLDFELAR